MYKCGGNLWPYINTIAYKNSIIEGICDGIVSATAKPFKLEFSNKMGTYYYNDFNVMKPFIFLSNSIICNYNS